MSLWEESIGNTILPAFWGKWAVGTDHKKLPSERKL